MVDAVVVGGGVAGAAVAIHLGRKGRRALLLDRAGFPRRKACGEGLFPRGVRELQALDVFDRIAAKSEIHSLRFHAHGHTAEARFSDAAGGAGGNACGVSRLQLDAVLQAAAHEAGVEVRIGERVLALVSEEGEDYTLFTNAGEIEAPVIIAADGLNSGLRRQAGLESPRRGSRFGISAHIELDCPAGDAVDVHFRDGFEIYVTPVGPREVNVALLMSRKEDRGGSGGLIEAFSGIVAREGLLPEPWRLIDEPLAAGPFSASARKLWDRNLVLVGDAAGFFDGITGEGMSVALASARDCGEAVDEYLATGSDAAFSRYEAKRKAMVRNSELLGRMSLTLAGHTWAAKRAIRALERRPRSFERLIAVSSGDAGLRSLRPMDVLGLIAG